MLSVWFSLLVACLVVVADLAKQNPDVIKWHDLKVVMLRTGNLTRGSAPRPQMTTTSRFSELKNVTCIATGHAVKQKKNFPRVEWSCVPDEMPLGSKMDVERVSCECYDFCSEDYILIGSCSLEYTVYADFTSGWVICLIVGTVLVCTFFLCMSCKFRRLRRENSRDQRQ